MTGVKPCECRDCMEVTHAENGLCRDCDESGCCKWDGECLAELWATESFFEPEDEDDDVPPNAGSAS